jgi:Kef-type K+ transport system membrane component KefB
MSMWPVQLCIILLATALCGSLAKRLGQSRVVGEIAAGLLLGPAVLGAIDIDTYNAIFSPAAMQVMSLFGELGLVLLMFQLGLHLDIKSLRGRAQMQVPAAVALMGILLPFAIGCAIAVLSRPHIAPQAPALGYVLFCGIALSISAMPVMARIVLDLRMAGSFIAAVALTAASLTDLLGWLLLAVIVAVSADSFSWGHNARNIALLLTFILVSMLIMRPLWYKAIAMTSTAAITVRTLPFVIGYILILAWVTTTIGFHSAFGALMAALVLRGLPGLDTTWEMKIEGFVGALLMPVFFALAGIQATSGNMATPGFWLWFGLFFIGAVVGKFGGSYLGARLTGVGKRDSAVIGALMNTRGLMELIVLTIGLKSGILPPGVYTMLFIMALVTTAMTVPILRWFGYGKTADSAGSGIDQREAVLKAAPDDFS